MTKAAALGAAVSPRGSMRALQRPLPDGAQVSNRPSSRDDLETRRQAKPIGGQIVPTLGVPNASVHFYVGRDDPIAI
jgi:hypothetical protein